MSTTIVNGYVCFNCTDQAKAQKGVDPANPTNDPAQNKSVQTKKAETIAIAKAEVAKNGPSSLNRVTGVAAAGATSGTASAPVPAALLLPGLGGGLDVTA